MVRYLKSGSDATSAAIRVARDFTGRDVVVTCGYHGWHDWYVPAMGKTAGVPDAVQALTLTTPFNDSARLESLLHAKHHEIAALILEPTGKETATPEFLHTCKRLTAHYGIVLVFDEVVTGFRVNLGGAQAHYGVTPDLACFGKALANGLPLSVLTGSTTLMSRLEHIFVSSTFGGETLSLAAGLATVRKLRELDVPKRLWAHGETLKQIANTEFREAGLNHMLQFAGDGWWPRLSVTPGNLDANVVTSLVRQELVGAGLLLVGGFNLCLAHMSPEIVDKTQKALHSAAAAIRDAVDSPTPAANIRGDAVRPNFSIR